MAVQKTAAKNASPSRSVGKGAPTAVKKTGARKRSPRKEQPPRPAAESPTRGLGVFGWHELDDIVLAALATESPVLLVGAHGTAKTMLAERVAAALRQEFRHYNASLVNYDDLVGIPLPEEGGTRLRFVSTPGSIWDAEFVLLDELSRSRPDLQNKLFPIIHERRVAGVGLPRLRHRWAAMNPPSSDDDLAAGGSATYLGAEPLDPALVDRFPFVVRVPDWGDLTKQERRSLVETGGIPDPELDLVALVARCRDRIEAQEASLRPRVCDWAAAVVDQLRAGRVVLSGRRAAALARNALAVHAARTELGYDAADLERSVEQALVHSLPQTADETPAPGIAVRAAHRQAWELSGLDPDDAWRKVLAEPDPVERVLIADRERIGDGDLARLVTQALGAQADEPRRIGLATAMFLRFRDTRQLTPAAWEPLAQLSRRVLEPRVTTRELRNASGELGKWRTLNRALVKNQCSGLERNLLLDGFPDLWQTADWKVALTSFRDDLLRFGVAQ